MTETLQTEQIEKQETEIIYAGEETVKTLLNKLKKLKLEKDVAVGSLELNLQELKDEIHQKSMPFDQQATAIEAEIKSIMPGIARTIKTEYGAANYRKGSIRVSYDSKALDACIDEYVRNAILPYRKETPVSPSVSIEVY